jgi:MFS family permease
VTRAALRLAAGVVALEFAAAVSSFVSATLLPTVATALDARAHLGLLLAGPTLGLFVALPLAPAVLHQIGSRRTLAAGIVVYLAGAAISATAVSAWVYTGGRFAGGLASGLLAVFGVSAVIRELDERVRTKVVAASSAMWILPAFVGPPVTLALEHAVGWPGPPGRRRTSLNTGRWGARCWSRPGWRSCWPPARRCWSRPARRSRWSAWPG